MKKLETGWIDDVFSDFLKDSTYHLEDNLPHLSEVLAEECFEYIEKPLITEFLEDLNKCVNVKQYTKLKEKWEKRLKV